MKFRKFESRTAPFTATHSFTIASGRANLTLTAYPRLVISSSNEDSEFFPQKLTKRKKHIGKRQFVFLLNNLLDYLGASFYLCQYSLFFEPPAKK